MLENVPIGHSSSFGDNAVFMFWFIILAKIIKLNLFIRRTYNPFFKTARSIYYYFLIKIKIPLAICQLEAFATVILIMDWLLFFKLPRAVYTVYTVCTMLLLFSVLLFRACILRVHHLLRVSMTSKPTQEHMQSRVLTQVRGQETIGIIMPPLHTIIVDPMHVASVF